MRGFCGAWLICFMFTCGFVSEEAAKKGHHLAAVAIVAWFIWPIILGEELAEIVKKANPAEAGGEG